MDWLHTLVVLVGHNRIIGYVIVSYLVLNRLPWLIAAFRVAKARDTKKAGLAVTSPTSMPRARVVGLFRTCENCWSPGALSGRMGTCCPLPWADHA